MRLVPEPGRQRIDQMARRANSRRCRSAQLRKVRGREIAMIFQEPMTALNPVLPVRLQIDENLQAHTDARGASAQARRRVDRHRRHPGGRARVSTIIRTSSPAACGSAR